MYIKVMGIPLYGRSFTLASYDFGNKAPAFGPGNAGKNTNFKGFLAFNEVIFFNFFFPSNL